jgi:putative SOS response-associated peptidase YedK
MCGRFALTLPHDAVAGFFEATHVKAEFSEPRYNVCPTQEIPVAVEFGGERYLTPMRWGFIPHWYKSPTDGPLLINARSETVTEKPAFREAAQKRRCLIPVSGFYEWHREQGKGKEPWYFTQNDADLFAFAGIWQAWTSPETGKRQVTCGVLTTAAGKRMAQIHHREPVVINPSDFGDWLLPDTEIPVDKLHHKADDFYHRHRVSTAVNGARAGDPSLIEPIEE